MDNVQIKPIKKKAKSPLYRLFQLASSRQYLILTAIVFSVFSGVLSFVPAFIIWLIAGHLLSPNTASLSLSYIAFSAMILFVIRLVCISVSTITAHYAAFNILYDVRMAIARKISSVPLGFITKNNSASIKTILQEDVERIEFFIAHFIPDLAAAIITPIVAVAILFWVDWRLGIAGIIAIPLAIIFQTLLYRDVDSLMAENVAVQKRMNAALVQYIQGIKVIKTFGIKSYTFPMLSTAIHDHQSVVNKFSKKALPAWAFFQVSLKTTSLFLIPLGCFLTLEGTISISDFILVMTIGYGMTSPFMRIIFAAGKIRMIEQGLTRIDTILLSAEQSQRGKYLSPKNTAIEFKKVNFSYENKSILNDLSFVVPERSLIAIVGESGSGKTTIAHLIGRFWDCNSGQVLLGDIDIRDMSLEMIGQHISFMFQDVFLFDDTIYQNIKMAKNNATEQEVINACIAAGAHDFISNLPEGYNTVVGEKGSRFSGGQCQRISIARTLLKDAPIIVLDEATAFIDSLNEMEIMQSIEKLTQNKTVLMITHNTNLLAKADNIIIINKGQIVAEGCHQKMLKENHFYQNIWHNEKEACV